MLGEPGAVIEGPEDEVMRAIESVLRPALGDELGRKVGERLTYRLLARIEARLADRGYVVRHVDEHQVDVDEAAGDG